MTATELLRRYEAGELVFKGADLHGVDLSYANLRRICLYAADLADANLRYARFDGADLHYANLTGSNWQNWNTQGANLWSVFS